MQVLEQIKTAIESRNQLASAETHVPLVSILNFSDTCVNVKT